MINETAAATGELSPAIDSGLTILEKDTQDAWETEAEVNCGVGATVASAAPWQAERAWLVIPTDSNIASAHFHGLVLLGNNYLPCLLS